MIIPLSLQDKLHQSYLQMIHHPQHLLPTKSRREVYDCLSKLADDHSYLISAYLAIITAKKVIASWQNTWPQNNLVELIIFLAEDLIQGIISEDKVRAEISDAVDVLDHVAHLPDAFSHLDAIFAGKAAISALIKTQRVVAGLASLDPNYSLDYNVGLPEDKVNELPWQDLWLEEENDTVLWAAAAFAGGFGYRTITPADSRKFYEWWLRQAIPSAWVFAKTKAWAATDPRARSAWINEQSIDPLTEKAFKIAHEVGFEFPRSIYDRGNAGKHYACLIGPYLDNLLNKGVTAIPVAPDLKFESFFESLVQHLGKSLVIADSRGIEFFYPNGGRVSLMCDKIVKALSNVSHNFLIKRGFIHKDEETKLHPSEHVGMIVIEMLFSPNPEIRFDLFRAVLVSAGVPFEEVRQEWYALEQNSLFPSWEEIARVIYAVYYSKR